MEFGLHGLPVTGQKVEVEERNLWNIEYIENKEKIAVLMYAPQMIMLIVVFTLGIYVPPFLNSIITTAISGF